MELKGFTPFPKSISPQVNLIARHEFELTPNDITVQYLIQYTKVNPS